LCFTCPAITAYLLFLAEAAGTYIGVHFL